MGKRATFTQNEVTRAVRGVTACGLTPSRAEILPDGRIVVHIAGRPEEDTRTPFQKWKDEQNASAAERP